MKNKFYLYFILCFLFNVAGYSQSTVFESLSFESNKLGRKVSYSIYLPSDYNTSKRNYPVLYLLHGYTDNETNWIQMGQMKTIADRAIANEEAAPMIIVMPDAWDTWYINQYDGKAPYEDMFFEELIPYMEKTYRIRSNKESRAIAGLSMGGYGAMLHGLSAPERFAAIGSFSGAVFGMVAPGERPKETPEYPPYLLKKCAEEGKKIPPIYLACGEDDFLYEMNKEFLGLLEENKTDVTWVSLPGYGHEWRFWNMQVEEFMKWIPRTDGYAGKETRKV